MRKAKAVHPDDQRSPQGDQTDQPENARDDREPKASETAKPSGDNASAPQTAETPQATVEQLRERIEKLEDSLLREKAECRNVRRRAAIENAQAVRYANARLLKSLLEVLDDFDRALNAAVASNNHKAVIEGVRLVHQKLMTTLGNSGLQVIDALGRTFDPNLHDAVLHQPTADLPAGMVIEEVAKGYRLHDQLLRPAKVVVSKAREEDVENKEDSGQEAQNQGS